MENKDVVFAMKVVPHKKSVWTDDDNDLNSSGQWMIAKKINQNYLYVNDFDEEAQAWVLSANYPELVNNVFYDGDFFSSDDFEKIIEL